jgi:hypothetical protein
MICPSSAVKGISFTGTFVVHKQSECKKESFSDYGDDSSSESDMENDNKDENHVDDQENDMTNDSKEEEVRKNDNDQLNII